MGRTIINSIFWLFTSMLLIGVFLTCVVIVGDKNRVQQHKGADPKQLNIGNKADTTKTKGHNHKFIQ